LNDSCCAWPKCNFKSDIIWKGKGLCLDHWGDGCNIGIVELADILKVPKYRRAISSDLFAEFEKNRKEVDRERSDDLHDVQK